MNAATNDRSQLVLTRVLKAPRELIYRAWTEPEQLAHWCMPSGFTVPSAESDIRPGGEFRTCLKAPDGSEHWVCGKYTELTPPECIVFTHAWEQPGGELSAQTVVTITLEALDANSTRLTLTQTGFDSVEARDGHAQGWSETLDSLAPYLASLL